MLLVHDQQAELLELYRGLQQLVGTDHDINLAGGHVREDVTQLFSRPEPGQYLDTHRPLGETVAEVLVMLLCQQRRRHQQGDLLAILHRQERGTHGDLGLAEANVTTHQPVHRHGGLHILEHDPDRLFLVRGFFKWKVAGKACIFLFRAAVGIALARRPPCVDIQQLDSHIVDAPGCLATRTLPLVTTEFMQRGMLR